MFKRAVCPNTTDVGLAVAAFLFALTFRASAQQTSPYDVPHAVVTYPSSGPTKTPVSVFTPGSESGFALVGLQPGQSVQVVVKYPTQLALQLVKLEALDGGTVLPPATVAVPVPGASPILSPCAGCVPVDAPSNAPVSSLKISYDGTLSFTYVATQAPGRNQVSLRIGTAEMGLQFWVLDSQNPQGAPAAITADNPYPADTSN